jgi:hypothetical protein
MPTYWHTVSTDVIENDYNSAVLLMLTSDICQINQCCKQPNKKKVQNGICQLKQSFLITCICMKMLDEKNN